MSELPGAPERSRGGRALLLLLVSVGLLAACLDFSVFKQQAIGLPDAGCAEGFATCSSDPADHCAADLSSPPTCGSCDNHCTAGCSQGQCVGVANMALAKQFSCALMTNGEVRCWGGNDKGQLGAPPNVTTSPTPRVVQGTQGAVQVCTGNEHGCVLYDDAGVGCWGANFNGQLGLGTTDDSSDPSNTGHPLPAAVKNLGPMLGIGCAAATTCGYNTENEVWCWGDNSYGELSNNTTTNSNLPVAVQGLTGSGKIVQINGGRQTLCARYDSGKLYCWGRNIDGEQGVGDYVPHFKVGPSVTGLNDVLDIQGGSRSMCALTDGGNVYCWGLADGGQLGSPAAGVRQATPFHISPSGFGPRFTLALGDDTACAASTSNLGILCWGANDGGEVGEDGYAVASTPVGVNNLSGKTENLIVAGAWHFCMRYANGQIACWGNNDADQLGFHTDDVPPKGDDLNPHSAVPVPVSF